MVHLLFITLGFANSNEIDRVDDVLSGVESSSLENIGFTNTLGEGSCFFSFGPAVIPDFARMTICSLFSGITISSCPSAYASKTFLIASELREDLFENTSCISEFWLTLFLIASFWISRFSLNTDPTTG